MHYLLIVDAQIVDAQSLRVIMITRRNVYASYASSLILILSIILGALTGYFFGNITHYLKPIGDLFLNLIFTTIVPLVFFNVSSAIARTRATSQLSRIFIVMSMVFVLTSVVAASLALWFFSIFPPAPDIDLTQAMPKQIISGGFLNQIAGVFSVSDFSKLFSHEHMLALIIFAILVGLAAASTNSKKANGSVLFLQSGDALFMCVFSLIMRFAPLGFFAWFAVLTHELGPALMQNYVRVTILYYVFALAYFILAYTLYAGLSGKKEGIILFWKNIFLPVATSLATCSSIASIPANLIAMRAMRVSPEIAETVIPLGSILHKEGSVIGGVVKIAFVFGLFHLKFAGVSVLLTALGVSLLVGSVMGAIPGGGMLGELMILTAYGLPPSALIAMSAISILIDPIATMLNVVGNSVSSMMIARVIHGAKWFKSGR